MCTSTDLISDMTVSHDKVFIMQIYSKNIKTNDYRIDDIKY